VIPVQGKDSFKTGHIYADPIIHPNIEKFPKGYHLGHKYES
jgi:hypothetical protein